MYYTFKSEDKYQKRHGVLSINLFIQKYLLVAHYSTLIKV